MSATQHHRTLSFLICEMGNTTKPAFATGQAMLWGPGVLGVLSRQTVAGGVGRSQGSPARPGKGTGPSLSLTCSLNPPPPPGPLRAQRNPGPLAPGSVRCGPGGKLGWGSWGLSHRHKLPQEHKPPRKRQCQVSVLGTHPDMCGHVPTCGNAPGGGVGGACHLEGLGTAVPT